MRVLFILLLGIQGLSLQAQVSSKNTMYEAVRRMTSPFGSHIIIGQIMDGHKVLYAGQTQHYTANNQIIIQDYRVEPVSSIFGDTTASYLYKRGDSLHCVEQELVRSENPMNSRVILKRKDGLIVHQSPLYRFHCSDDTTLKLPVFYPNPVVSSGEVYGGWLVDRGDSSNHFLDEQLILKNLRFKQDEEGNLSPQHSLLRFKNVSPPNDGSHQTSLSDLPENRSDHAFELVNAYYHLENYSKMIAKLGYKDLLDTVVIDVHGFYSLDQSAYDAYSFPPTIEYGFGGVDDAEDGQVVIHEFVHSMIQNASPFTFQGDDRQAMEEGIADYLAMSYSHSLSGSSDVKVFSWDGHNEFWTGFLLDADKTYTNKIGYLAHDREIWSSTLNCIREKIGWQKTDALVLESLFYLIPDQTMPEMGKLLLRLDSIIHGARHHDEIASCLDHKMLLDIDDSAETLSKKPELFVFNSNHTGHPLKLRLTQQGYSKMGLYNTKGQEVYSLISERSEIIIPKNNRPLPHILQLKFVDRTGKIHYFNRRVLF